MKVNGWISSLFLLSAVASAFPTISTTDQDLARRDEDITVDYGQPLPIPNPLLPRALPKKAAPKAPTRSTVRKPTTARKPTVARKPTTARKPTVARKPTTTTARKPAQRGSTTPTKTSTKSDPEVCMLPSKKGGKRLNRRGNVCGGASATFDIYIFADNKKAGPNSREHCGIFIALKPNTPAGFVTGTLLDSVNKAPGESFALKPRWKENHITDPQNRFKGGPIGSITESSLNEFKTKAWPGLRAPNGVETEQGGSMAVADCQTFTGQIRTALGPYMS